MESIHSQQFWILSSALFAGLASAQSLEDELGELASEAVSVFTSVTSEVVSMWTELTSIVANAPAATNSAASSATATPASSLASQSSSIASESAILSSASSLVSSALSSLESSSESASSRASASSASSASSALSSSFSSASSALSSLSSSLSSSLDPTSSHTTSHSSARSTGSSSTLDPSSSSASSQVAASSPNSDSNLSSSHHSHPNVVGIVVGTIVGALVLGLLILLALLCLRRRRRRRRRTGVSPTDAEVESWRNTHDDQYAFLGPGSERATAGHDNVMAAAAVPAMREGSMHNRHHNPFAPAVPPPRRVAANSRPGVTDGAVPGQSPFNAAAVRTSGIHPAYRGDPAAAARNQHHGFGKELAVGAGGALLGAAAMKHHNDKDRRKESIEMPADTPKRHSIQRKPVGVAMPNMNEDTSAESTLLNNRHSLDHQNTGYKSDIVSPISPTEPAELPSPSYDHAVGGDNEPLLGGSGGGRGEKAAGLFALAASANRRNHDRNNSANRPMLQRASSSDYDDVPKAVLAGQSSNRPSYQSYQPQDSPTLATSASSSYPATRSSSTPDVPARSPARASFGQDTPPTDSSTDSLSKTAASSSSRRRSASVEAAEAALERDEAADQVSDTLLPAMWRRSAESPRMPPKGVSYHDFKPVRRDVSTGYNNANFSPAGASAAAGRRLSGGGDGRSGAYAQLTGQQGNPFAGGSPRESRRVSLSELIEEEKRLEAARQRRSSRGSGGGVGSPPHSPWHSGAATPTEAYEGRGYGVGQAL